MLSSFHTFIPSTSISRLFFHLVMDYFRSHIHQVCCLLSFSHSAMCRLNHGVIFVEGVKKAIKCNTHKTLIIHITQLMRGWQQQSCLLLGLPRHEKYISWHLSILYILVISEVLECKIVFFLMWMKYFQIFRVSFLPRKTAPFLFDRGLSPHLLSLGCFC